MINDMFITKTKNDAGIYAVRFYIRGKPWVVTVDDYFLFHDNDSTGAREGYYTKIGAAN